MSSYLRGVDLATGNTLTPNDPRTIVVLRSARTPQEKEAVTRLVLDKRRKYKEWVTIEQRHWQSKVSRRPQRGNHHDSWSIREKYIRG